MNSGEESTDNMNGNWISNSEIANQVISKYTGNSSSSNKRKTVPIPKDDDDYTKKRARNNVAVKKSREKAKNKIQETQVRVEQLSKENEDLQTKVTLLSKELNVLRALFTNGGFALPCDLQLMNGSSAPEHSPISHGHRSPPSQISDDSAMRHISSLSSAEHDTKIPPLRPTPRVPNFSSSKSHIHSPSRNYQSERDSIYNNYSMKSDEYNKNDNKLPSSVVPPLLIQPGSSVNASYHSSPPHHKSETQHTSVIRSASELNNGSLSINTLGKFCIIQDPENNGQVKIVPINS